MYGVILSLIKTKTDYKKRVGFPPLSPFTMLVLHCTVLYCAVLTVLGFVSITSSQTTSYITTIGSFRRDHSVVGVE